MKPGLFITFEGGEGAGKTTQIKRLAASLPNAVMTREPGGTPEAEALRNVFIEQQGQEWPLEAQLFIMSAGRVLHTRNFIKPSLALGKTVLCDRYFDSTLVYQGMAGGLTADQINGVKHLAIGDFAPHITFILDIDEREGLRRAGGRNNTPDTFETKDLGFHTAVRNGFLTIASQNPERCVIVDAARDEDIIAREILDYVKNHSASRI
jgi:dTMP kinase